MQSYIEYLDMLPSHMREPMQSYIEKGWLPGGFLTSVLANDLRGAFGRADHWNRPRIGDFVEYLMMYAPASCWGSEDVVSRWVARGGLEGKKETADGVQ